MHLQLLHLWILYFCFTMIYCDFINNCSFICLCSNKAQFCSAKLATLIPEIKGDNFNALNYSQNPISDFQSLNLSFCKNLISLNFTLNEISNLQSGNICHVLEIDLSFNKLDLFESNILLNLPELKVLNLSDNFISSFPNFLKSNKLNHLSLKHNRISQLLPSDFTNLAELRELKFGSNSLTRLTKNNFASLVSLRKLDLESNGIAHLEGLTFFGLSNLLSLNLRKNNVSSLVDATFWGLSNLNYLDLSFNNIYSIDHKWLYGLYHLNTLSLAHNRICYIDEKAWSSTLNLTEINLRWNNLSQINSKNFNYLTNLRSLHLQHNNIQFISPNAFADLRLLRTLDLSNNRLFWVINIMDRVFDNLPSLLKLNLKNNNIQSIPANAFKYVKKLKSLNLGNNQILRIERGAFSTLQDLSELYITSSNMLCDCHLGHVVQLLKQLNISTSASCSFPVSLRSLQIMHIHNATGLECRDDIFSLPRILNQSGSVEIVEGSNVTLTCTAISPINMKVKITWYKNGQIVSIKDEMSEKKINESHAVVHSRLFFQSINQQKSENQILASHLYSKQIPFNSSNKQKMTKNRRKDENRLINNPEYAEQKFRDKSTNRGTTKNHLQSNDKIKSIYAPNNNISNKREINIKNQHDYNDNKSNVNQSDVYEIQGDNIHDAQKRLAQMQDYEILNDEIRDEYNINDEDNLMQKDEDSVNRVSSDETHNGEIYDDNNINDDKESVNWIASYDVNDEISGEYNCLAWNALGAVQSNLSYVDINIYANFVNLPTSPVLASVGSMVQFDCSAISVPPPVISLQKIDSSDFPAAVDRRLHIYPDDDVFFIVNVQLKDAGVYACHATNRAGDIKANITLKVLDKGLTGDKNFKVWRESDTIVLECLAKPLLNLTLIWRLNNQNLPKTPRHIRTTNLLIITDANLSDSGVYTCVYGDIVVETIVVEVGASIDAVAVDLNSKLGGRMIGAIIIAVVSCVVGTSIVWVCFIYKSRRSQINLSYKSQNLKKKMQLYSYPAIASESLQPLGENEYKEIGIGGMSPLQLALIHEERRFKSDSGTHSFSSNVSYENLQTAVELDNNMPSTNQNTFLDKENYYLSNQNTFLNKEKYYPANRSSFELLKKLDTTIQDAIPQTKLNQIKPSIFLDHDTCNVNESDEKNLSQSTFNSNVCCHSNSSINSPTKSLDCAGQTCKYECGGCNGCQCKMNELALARYSDKDHNLTLNNQTNNIVDVRVNSYLKDGVSPDSKNKYFVNHNTLVNNLTESGSEILTVSPWVLQK